jgi:type II secretory pathway pseudopilin PulG
VPASRSPAVRRGVSVAELVFAILIVSVMLLTLARVMSIAANQRRELGRRQIAVQEANNLLERITGRDWDEIDESKLASIELSPRAKQSLPAAELRIQVQPEDGPPPAKRIVVEVGWQAHGPDAVATVRLSAWKHRRAEDAP